MSFLSRLFGRGEKPAASAQASATVSGGRMFNGMDDPALLEFIREGGGGGTVTVTDAMKNPAVFRSVTLISYAIGMLPLHLFDAETKEKAREHPLFKVLHRQPNQYQTAFNFRQVMQRWALTHGNAYAQIIRSRGRVFRLMPIHPDRVTVKQNDDWSIEYRVSGRNRSEYRVIAPTDMFHVYGQSDNGYEGESLVKVAADTISLANDAQMAAARLFRNGMMVGGALKHPGKLSPEALQSLQSSMEERFAGVANAHKWMVLEEGMDAHQFAQTAEDSQQIETRAHQVEEIGRIFGVPRPFLGVDDTSWGSGIDVLGQIFVRYALNPWFQAWEQAIERSLLTDDERDAYEAKFNAGALIRGNMKDQAEFFAKALGSGGHQPWLHYSEVRDMSDLPEREIAPNPMANRGKQNERPETAKD